MSILDVTHRRLADASLALQYLWSRPPLLFVLGMHRSGTSCASRILNLMGAGLGAVRGDADVAPGEEAHWESPAVNWLNEEILVQSGGDWRRPPTNVRFSRRDVWRCRRVLWELGGSHLGAIKDPRMLITYPVWRQARPDHGIVACLRHPLNVARSLERRDGMTIDEGLDLWHAYNLRLLEHTSNGSVYWFDFDAGAAGAERLIHRLAADFPLTASPEALCHYNPAEQHHADAGRVPGRVGDRTTSSGARERQVL
jgi:hypothetical protein